MKVHITWRIDTEEVYTTDDAVYTVKDWTEALAHVAQIEACTCTVLSIERVD